MDNSSNPPNSDQDSKSVDGTLKNITSLPANLAIDKNYLDSLKTESEKDTYLFEWLTRFHASLRLLSPKKVASLQKVSEDVIVEYLFNKDIPTNRAFRVLSCRLLVFIYACGSTSSLFDYVCKAHDILKGRKQEEENLRVSAAFFLGKLLANYGFQLISLLGNSVVILYKLVKTTRTISLELRYGCAIALSHIFLQVFDESNFGMPVKEVYKLCKSAFYEKTPALMRIGYLEMMRSILDQQLYMPFSKFDDIQTIILSLVNISCTNDRNLRKSVIGTITSVMKASQATVSLKLQKRTEKKEQSILTLSEMFKIFSNVYVMVGQHSRSLVVDAYIGYLRYSGAGFIESYHSDVVDGIVNFARLTQFNDNLEDNARSRMATNLVFREGVSKILGEVGQLKVLHYLIRTYLDKWNTDPIEEQNLDDHTLICILNEVASLVSDLGEAASVMENLVVNSFMNLMTHPAEGVIIALSWAMLSFFKNFPIQIPIFISSSLSILQKEIPSALNNDLNHDLFQNYGLILATLIRSIAFKKLYISYSTMANIFGFATHILKVVFNMKESKPFRRLVQTAWRLLAALMCLGPDFITVHMPQLLLIWKSVFQKPPSITIIDKLSNEEIAYMLITKDAALTCVYSFCKNYLHTVHKSDVGKRISVCLNNTLLFLSAISSHISAGSSSNAQKFVFATSDFLGGNDTKIPLECLESSLRRKLCMCYELITPPGLFGMSHAFLLKEAIRQFTLDGKDDGIIQNEEIANLGQRLLLIDPYYSNISRMNDESNFCSEGLLLTGGLESAKYSLSVYPGLMESDPYQIFLYDEGLQDSNIEKPVPRPPFLLNSRKAIEVFALLFPLQPGSRQEKISELLSRLATHTRGKSMQKLLTIQTNILLAFNKSLDTVINKKGAISSMHVIQSAANLSNNLLISYDPAIRCLAADLLGKLCRIADSSQFHTYVFGKWINVIINNTDPTVRAGACIALGSIVKSISGMSAHSHLDQVVSILDSLSRDSHPLVHTWALHSLALVIEGSGLMFRPYIDSTLQLIYQLLISKPHQVTEDEYPEGGEHNNNNLVSSILCRCLNSVMGVLGPELEDEKNRCSKCIYLYDYFKNEDDPLTIVEALRCNQKFIMFCPKAIDKRAMIPFLRLHLTSSNNYEDILLRRSAITCLYQISKAEPDLLLSTSSEEFSLEEQIFFMLDVETNVADINEIKDTLICFLHAICINKPSKWLDLCKNILLKTGGSSALEKELEKDDISFDIEDNDFSDNESTISDDENAAVIYDTETFADDENIQDGEVTDITHDYIQDPQEIAKATLLKMSFKSLIPRWNTQLFALKCINEILNVADNSGIKEHFDLILAAKAARRMKIKPDYLVFRLNDLIRVSFTAATSSINVLRLGGFTLIQDILSKFKYARDPHIPRSALLEQYQAQIAASLTPAMSLNSHPEVLAKACTTAAAYVGSGITDDINALSRVIRMLNSLLENFSESENSKKGFSSPNLELTVNISILTAWAELQNTSSTYKFLESVTGPYLNVLSKLWMQHLVWYGILRINLSANEVFHRSIGDLTYLNITRSLLLPIYEESWIPIMNAVMGLKEHDSKIFARTLSGKCNNSDSNTVTYEAVYIIYGLCFQCLSQKLNQIPKLKMPRSIVQSNLADIYERDKIEQSIKISIKTMIKLLSSSEISSAFIGSQIVLESIYLVSRYINVDNLDIKLMIVELFNTTIDILKLTPERSGSPISKTSCVDVTDRLDMLVSRGIQYPLHEFIMQRISLGIVKDCVERLNIGRGSIDDNSNALTAALQCMIHLSISKYESQLSVGFPTTIQTLFYVFVSLKNHNLLVSKFLSIVKYLFAFLSSLPDLEVAPIKIICKSFLYTLLEVANHDLNLTYQDVNGIHNTSFRSLWLLAICCTSFAPNILFDDKIKWKICEMISNNLLRTNETNVILFFKSMEMLVNINGDSTESKEVAKASWISIFLPFITHLRVISIKNTIKGVKYSLPLSKLLVHFNDFITRPCIMNGCPKDSNETDYRLMLVALILKSEINTVTFFLKLPESESITQDFKRSLIRNCSGTLLKQLTERYQDDVRNVIRHLDDKSRQLLQLGLS